ncbi:MAG: HDIG domain-containing protein [Bacteroidales bacterium]|nr:HDIG domain-containing protein [Bacteroidales bacterium]
MRLTARLDKFLPLLLVAALIAAVAPRTAKFSYDYKKGSIWKYETLFAQFDFPIYKTSEQIQEEMEKAQGARVPYYKYSAAVTASSLSAAEALELGAMKPVVTGALRNIMEKGVLADDEVPEHVEIIYVQKDKRAVKVPSSEVLGISQAREMLMAEVPDSLLKAHGVYGLIIPNLVYDAKTSEAVSAEAISRISPTGGYISAGQLIVSNGEVVTAEIAQILDSYKKEYENNVGSSGQAYLSILGNVMVAFMMVFLFFLAILFSGKSFFDDIRYYYLVFVFTLCSVAITLISRINSAWLFLTPLTLAALYLQAFVRARVIVPVYIVSLLPLLVYADHGAVLFVIFLAGGMVSIYASRYLVQGWKQFMLALINFLAMGLTYIALHLAGAIHTPVLPDLLRLLIASFLAVAGYPLIYLFEKIFNLVSNSRLAELADTSSPILRELEQKAPGTFQHSLQVMNMADAAARAIDANPFLLRVGALYHDIGKMNNPICFVENESLLNKSEDQKYHTNLEPKQSAEDIIKHVSDGVEMARKLRLPDIVVDFIRTHHGTTVTGYFWGKHLAAKGSPEDKAAFTYPGPAPTTKEQVVLMLCDSIEAASRTLNEYTPEAFSAFVEKIVQGKVDQGQLLNAEITIKELNEVKQAIKVYLAQMHHGRVAYPATRKKFLNFK